MTRFEKFKNITIEEMTEAVLCIVCECEDVCLNQEASSCAKCIFNDLCSIQPETNVREWLESEVGNGEGKN